MGLAGPLRLGIGQVDPVEAGTGCWFLKGLVITPAHGFVGFCAVDQIFDDALGDAAATAGLVKNLILVKSGILTRHSCFGWSDQTAIILVSTSA